VSDLVAVSVTVVRPCSGWMGLANGVVVGWLAVALGKPVKFGVGLREAGLKW
jgi:hypothetical protein